MSSLVLPCRLLFPAFVAVRWAERGVLCIELRLLIALWTAGAPSPTHHGTKYIPAYPEYLSSAVDCITHRYYLGKQHVCVCTVRKCAVSCTTVPHHPDLQVVSK
jgi:hypothetical protein